MKFGKIKTLAVCFIFFAVVSWPTLFAVKYTLWAMFKFSGIEAIAFFRVSRDLCLEFF